MRITVFYYYIISRGFRLLLPVFILTTALWGCKKEQVLRSTNITNAQAAIMAASALSVNTYGLAGIKNDITLYAKNLTVNSKGCGVLDSSVVAKQEPFASAIDYNYALGYYYQVNCINNVADNLSSNIVYNGSFDSGNLSVVNFATSAINVASLSDAAPTYNLTGNYQTSGSFQTLDNSQLTGSNSININISNLLVNKISRSITAGAADVTISGTIKTSKSSFNYSGSVMFNDVNTATLTLSGINYMINLTTADVTAL